MILILFLGLGALLFQKDRLYAFSEVLTWLQKNKESDVLAALPASSPRGSIYDRNFRPLAATYESYAIYARPLEMATPQTSADLLAELLGLDKNNLLTDLKRERGFVWIATGLDKDLADAVKERNLRGIYQVVETKRFYPNIETAAHAVGFVENDQGLDGIEFEYNTLLRGDENNKAELSALHITQASDYTQAASHLVLNLDLLIQSKFERFLEKRVRSTGASKGAVLLMDANTGGILAMASYPFFNPNRYWEFPSSSLKNHVVTEPVYLGELGLIFQQAAAINLKNEKKSQETENPDGIADIPVLEPEILKRRKLSIAPRVDFVDPEYLVRFSRLLGFGEKPQTDIPLKDETPVSSSLLFTDPSFHTSALRLLTSFTALLNNGRIVTPHLLHKAYSIKNLSPIEPDLSDIARSASLHPDTSSDLFNFLASKWLRLNVRSMTSQTPMFFEAHLTETTTPEISADFGQDGNKESAAARTAVRIRQSVMLGAIPGRNPKLTMIALLFYPEDSNDINYGTLEAFGDKLSILSPDQDMIQKMLYVADQSPPIPSPDFWSSGGTGLSKNFHPSVSDKKESAADQNDSRKYMPDVSGKSLRAALQLLQHFNLDIKLVGSGRVTSQQPAAGAALQYGEKCTLKMTQEI